MLTTIRYYTPKDVPQELIDLGAVPGAQDARARNLNVEAGVLITGRPGSGKTLNLNGICEAAAAGGYTVIRFNEWSSLANYRAAVNIAATGSPVIIVIDEPGRRPRRGDFDKKFDVLRSIRDQNGEFVALVVAAESVGSVDRRLLARLHTHIDQDNRAIDGMPRVLTTAMTYLDGEWVKTPGPVWLRPGYGA
jgi:hypothetical protein